MLQASEGPPMVLIHGFGGNADHWRNNIPTLAKAGPVYAIDLLGENIVNWSTGLWYCNGWHAVAAGG